MLYASSSFCLLWYRGSITRFKPKVMEKSKKLDILMTKPLSILSKLLDKTLLMRLAAISQGMIQMFSNFLTLPTIILIKD